MIHPEALPCLKRQQLENLCNRIGVRSTGKKSELIARLEGYAMGRSGSMASITSKSCTLSNHLLDEPKDFIPDIEEDKENTNLFKNENGDLPEHLSIRVVKPSRPSTESNRSNLGNDCILDEQDMGAGVIFASSKSLNYLHGETNPVLDEQQILSKDGSKTEHPSSAIYPWYSLESRFGNSTLKSSSLNQQSRRLPSSSSTLSIPRNLSGAVKKLFKAPASSSSSLSKSHSEGSIRQHLEESGASASSHIQEATARRTRSMTRLAQQGSKEDKWAQSATVERVKRKRDPEDFSLNDQAEKDVPIRHALSPQRAIKPRPSRVGRTVVPTTVTKVPTKEFTFRMPHSPENIVKSTVKDGDAHSEGKAEYSPNNTQALTESILHEMNTRIAQNGRKHEHTPLQPSTSINNLPPSPLKTVSSRTRGRFSSEHEKHFAGLESISDHYAARKRHKETKEELVQGKACDQSSPKRQKIHLEEKPRVTFSASTKNVRSEEERLAVRRKLELSRQRRRNSVATSPRRSSISQGHAVPPSNHFTGRIGHAVRGIVGAAARSVRGPIHSDSEAAKATQKPKKANFDLQASLARKPHGYTPYSAKETVQILSGKEPMLLSPTRQKQNEWKEQEWMWIPSPPKRQASIAQKVEFPKGPKSPAPKKTRSSLSQSTRRGSSTHGIKKSNQALTTPSRTRPTGTSKRGEMEKICSPIPRTRAPFVPRPRTIAMRSQPPSSASASAAGHGSPRRNVQVRRTSGRGRGQSALAADSLSE